MKIAGVNLVFFFLSHTSWAQVSYLNDRFVTTTDVSDRALITKDIEAIHNSQSLDEALGIYTNGQNSIKQDGSLRTLKALGTSGEEKMLSEPEYRRFHHALTVTMNETEKFATPNYADDYIQRFLEKEDFEFVATSSVILTMWMYTIHELRSAHAACMTGDLNANGGSVGSLEEAVAFYVGQDQVEGSEEGFSLYALAQRAADAFDTVNESDEALVNEKFVALANDAQAILMDSESGPGSCLKVRNIVNSMISQMTIPLIQHLIKHLYNGSQSKIRQYALAIVPFLEGCDETDFAYLYDKLIVNYKTYSLETDLEPVLRSLVRSYSCLDITCEDIGKYADNETPCESRMSSTPIVGYAPNSDVVQHLKLDLDLLQMKLFLDSEAYDLAEDLYLHGRNSKKEDGMRKLSGLATSASRSVVPSYSMFEEYFKDPDYGHSIIMNALSQEGQFEGASPDQVKQLVHKTAQYMVMHMYILRELYDAVEDCKAGDVTNNDGNTKAIDEAWAFYVGSIEGWDVGGRENGQGMYALAKKRCEQFSSCNEDGGAKVNDELLAAFTDARDHMEALECEDLEADVQNIEPLLLAPLVQGSLRYAIANQDLEEGDVSGQIAEGYVFSRSHLPLVFESNKNAGTVIEESLDFNLEGKQVSNGAAPIFDVYAQALPGMGVACELIGEVEEYGGVCGDAKEEVAEARDGA